MQLDPDRGTATLTLRVPAGDAPASPEAAVELGSRWWFLEAGRELDDTVLRLRFNHPEIGTWILRTEGAAADVLAADELIRNHPDHWLLREIRLYWKRSLKRLDLSARTLVALVEPGSCFAGTLAELALAADRSFILSDSPATLTLTDANDGWYPMANGLARLHSRFWGRADDLARVPEPFQP